MSKKKLTFSISKWKDYRIQSMRESKRELQEASNSDIVKLADAMTRLIIGSPRTGVFDILKYRGVIAKYVDSENFDEIFNYLYRELKDVLIDTMNRAAAGR